MFRVEVSRVSAIFFFFQAEDGIRDLVRSRGLGDVYKRQGTSFSVGGEQIDLGVSIGGTMLLPQDDLDSALALSLIHI